MKTNTKPSCGCGGGPLTPTVVVVEAVKKRKRQPQTPKKATKTQLQLEAEQRNKNRKTVKKMVETAKRQLLQKYPPQQNVLTATKHKGIFFPPKEDTTRLMNREKVNKQVKQMQKEVRTKHKEATTKWKKSPSGTWTKK